MFTNYLFGNNKKDTPKEVTEKNTEILCKICYDIIDISVKNYYSPCQCKGSSALIHKTCYVELYKVEKKCSACLTEYPPSVINSSPLNTPTFNEVLEGFCAELNRILYDMGSYSEIQKVYNLFTSETDFFIKLSENYLKINDITTYGLKNQETIEYIRGGARLPRTTRLASIENIDMDQPEITEEDYDSETEFDDEYIVDIERARRGFNSFIGVDDEADQTLVDEYIAEDILNALEKISGTVYGNCMYDPTIEVVQRFYHITYLGTNAYDNLTIKKFKEVLNKYYIDISYHGLNYLAKNPVKVYQLMIMNNLYNLIKIIKNLYNIFGPDKINNLFGLLIMESIPFISYDTKAKWNKDIVNEITKGEVNSASYFENSVKKLRHWKLDLLGYGIQSMNYLIMFLSLYGAYSSVKYVGSYLF